MSLSKLRPSVVRQRLGCLQLLASPAFFADFFHREIVQWQTCVCGKKTKEKFRVRFAQVPEWKGGVRIVTNRRRSPVSPEWSWISRRCWKRFLRRWWTLTWSSRVLQEHNPRSLDTNWERKRIERNQESTFFQVELVEVLVWQHVEFFLELVGNFSSMWVSLNFLLRTWDSERYETANDNHCKKRSKR